MATWFANPQAKTMWEFVVEHWGRYGRTPTPVTLKDALPGCPLYDVQESYDYILDAFCEWRTNGLTEQALQQAALKVEGEDYVGARTSLRNALAQIDEEISTAHTSDVDLTLNVEERIENYLALRDLPGGLRGIPTGFPTIDRATQGLQPQQLVTIIAEPKVGKSTLVEAISKNVWEVAKVPMLFTFEMSNDEQSRRIDSMIANMAHSKLMSGDLDADDEARLRKRLGRMSGVPQAYHLIADPTSSSTISGAASKIETYQPDVVFIDGAYLMLDEISGEHNTAQALTNITRALKRMAQRFNIPVVVATQALSWKTGRGGKLSSGSIGYTSSFAQDSDVILGLQRVDVEDDEDTQDERILRVIDSRNCPRTETTLCWDWTEGRFEEWGSSDA